MVDHITAAKVLIAVPSSCMKYMSSHSKMLSRIIIIIVSFTVSNRIFGGSFSSPQDHPATS